MAFTNAFKSFVSEPNKETSSIIEIPEKNKNFKTEFVNNFIKIKIPRQNIFINGLISAYFKGDFQNLEINKDLFNASFRGNTKFEVSFPFLFLHDYCFANSVNVSYYEIDTTFLDVDVHKTENEKTFKVTYALFYSYSSKINYLETKYGKFQVADTQMRENEIAYKFVKKEGN